ncbi:MAG TPA: hypothetical protein VN029_08370 [Sphingomonas sp.]|nr:hypothetical protein [Sphingomonas sp.]
MSHETKSDAAPAPTTPMVLEGIVRQKCLSATYNRTAMILAPHILYTRHEALHVDAVVVLKEGVPPREEKIGTFKLDGLTEMAVIDRDFVKSELFDPALEKYQGETLMAVA